MKESTQGGIAGSSFVAASSRARESRSSVMVELQGGHAEALLLDGGGFDVAGVDFGCEMVGSGATAATQGDGASTVWLRAFPLTEAAEAALRGIAPWELAHRVRKSAIASMGQLLAMEPVDAVAPGGLFDPEEIQATIDQQNRCELNLQRPDWPRGPRFAWHLGAEYSQLEQARERADFGRGVRIAHIDTGYDPDHVTRPVNLRPDLGWNFHTNAKSTIDRYGYSPPASFGGHGTGTLALLAGNRVQMRGFDGYLGGAPLAEVVPLVASPSVITNPGHPENFVRAIDRAIELGCHVISMSCGGVPTIGLAQAAERAYNAGVVLVAAAGNFFCWVPPLIVAPAVFTTTIAAGGGMADHRHYAKGFPACMTQYGASYDPAVARITMVSGYSPNMPWAVRGCSSLVSHNGDGTSSSTPQVAAAAALWLKLHGDKYPANGRRVEACMRALRQTASAGPGPNADRMGAGLIRANAALDVLPAVDELETAELSGRVSCPQAQSLPGYDALSSLEQSMIECELAQVLYRVPVAAALSGADLRAIQQQPQLSSALRVFLAEAYAASVEG